MKNKKAHMQAMLAHWSQFSRILMPIGTRFIEAETTVRVYFCSFFKVYKGVSFMFYIYKQCLQVKAIISSAIYIWGVYVGACVCA